MAVNLPGPFYHGDMEVALDVLIIPFQDMSWLKGKISDQTDTRRALVYSLPNGAYPFKL